jgi:hypothetical protein
MDMLKIARESGLAIVLDAKIGREEYTSVSGLMSALLRFGEGVRSAPYMCTGVSDVRAPYATG